MPDKKKRGGKRWHRDRSDSSDSEANQNGRRRPRQQSPLVPFQPRFCGQCEPENQHTRYATRSSLTKHTVLNHGTWYHPGRNEYVAIPEDRLAAMRARYRAWQSHRPKGTRRRSSRSSCRAEASWSPRERSPSPPPSASGVCRVSTDPGPELSTLPPVTTGHWSPPPPVLATVHARLRSGVSVGRGYGILQHHAAEREPSLPASRYRPPLSSDSDDDLSCGQRVVTPESSDSSFEIISDTESDKRPARRTAPAPVVFGTLGGIPGTSTERPLLRFEDLFALARSAPVDTYGVVADNIQHEFQTAHDRDTLSALLMAMATARAATAAEVYQRAVQFVGEGQETPSAFLELIRHLDDLRHFR